MESFVILLWLKYSSAASILYLPKVYTTYAKCEKDAVKIRKHYADLYDPIHAYHNGDVADVYCY